MDMVATLAGSVAMGFGYAVVVALCLVGIVMSGLSLSGTWVVVVATVVAALMRPDTFPGVWTIVAFLVLSGVVEGVEALAGSWGVSRRGGSKLAGLLALVGGLAGLVLGSFWIPIPIVGGLLGMMIGSFLPVFLVERRRLQHAGHAAHIAMGSVLARVLVIFMKVGTTLAMSAILLIGMVL